MRGLVYSMSPVLPARAACEVAERFGVVQIVELEDRHAAGIEDVGVKATAPPTRTWRVARR